MYWVAGYFAGKLPTGWIVHLGKLHVFSNCYECILETMIKETKQVLNSQLEIIVLKKQGSSFKSTKVLSKCGISTTSPHQCACMLPSILLGRRISGLAVALQIFLPWPSSLPFPSEVKKTSGHSTVSLSL